MPVERLASLDDPRLEPYRNLKDRDVARLDDRFIAEGEHVVRRLLASDYPTESVLVAARREEALAPVVPPGAPLYVVPDALVESIVGFHFHSGVLACGRRKPSPGLDGFIEAIVSSAGDARPATLVVCPEVINTENLGGLMRIAAAFGTDGMILGERSCDPFWRRSIRVSMGAVFRLPLLRSDDLRRDLLRLRDRYAFQLAATVTDADAEPLASAARPGADGATDSAPRQPDRLALLLGSEAQGLQPRWLALCDRRITIPMRMGTDSLNVAVAAAVFLYHFIR